MALKNPILSNPIAVDIPKLNEILDALSKANPTDVDGISTGAVRLYEVSSGKWQWQVYNGSTWASVPFLQHNVDQLDGYHAAITPAENTVAVRNASGLLQDSITGNAATASSAATLSQTLPVAKGGTGATTSEAARSNLGVPPTSHASTNTTHGVGNATQYGHLKLSDAANSSSGVSGGVAATPAAVKAAKDAANNAMTKASTLATASSAGIVKPGTGMTVDAAGSLNVSLNNTVTSTSTTQAATANAVKTAYDKAEEASTKAGLPLGHIYLWPFPTPQDGSIQLNGSTYSRELYSDLWNLVKAKGWYKSESEWQSIASANGGFCPWYSEGDGSTNFRTPKFAPYQKIALASGDAGKYYEAGLPNITGKSWSPTWHGFTGMSYGAFYSTIENSSAPAGSTIHAEYNNDWWNFDASRSNPIYGNSTTVTPESHDWIVCVVAFGTATNVGSVDVANVMSAVSQVQAKLKMATPVGSVIAFAANSVPDGYLLCNGAAVSRTTYAALFAAIGTTYGAGDDSTTFNLPNLTDRFIQGSGTAGMYIAAGLPDHRHRTVAYGEEGNVDLHADSPIKNIGISGATDYKYMLQGQYSEATVGGTSMASAYNYLYGASATVQPPALTMCYYIKY